MDRIDGAGHVGRLFVAEDVGTNRPPTEITADWLNGVQEELLWLIEAAGLVPDAGNLRQVRAALNELYLPKSCDFGLIP